MKVRKEKNRTRYSTFILSEYLNDINSICENINIKKTRFLDKSLKLAFELYSSDRASFYKTSADNLKKVSYSTSLDKEDILRIKEISSETGISNYQIINKGVGLLLDICKEDNFKFFRV